ncbi:hypothetical protein Cni_G10654 [Canna indica]|uniref:Uncharacterized protein n=1 Tax=Canna indica TaxID=4628 RepID=A0AAQ3QAV8_9LILI|nr:hypothetical protein Cni_G10654 [Canna indica]
MTRRRTLFDNSTFPCRWFPFSSLWSISAIRPPATAAEAPFALLSHLWPPMGPRSDGRPEAPMFSPTPLPTAKRDLWDPQNIGGGMADSSNVDLERAESSHDNGALFEIGRKKQMIILTCVNRCGPASLLVLLVIFLKLYVNEASEAALLCTALSFICFSAVYLATSLLLLLLQSNGNNKWRSVIKDSVNSAMAWCREHYPQVCCYVVIFLYGSALFGADGGSLYFGLMMTIARCVMAASKIAEFIEEIENLEGVASVGNELQRFEQLIGEVKEMLVGGMIHI